MPSAMDVSLAGSGDRRSTDEDSWSADKTGDSGGVADVSGGTERCQLGLERVLDLPGVGGSQTVLCAQDPMCPGGRLVR